MSPSVRGSVTDWKPSHPVSDRVVMQGASRVWPGTVQPSPLQASFCEDSPGLALPHLTAWPAAQELLPSRMSAPAALPFLVCRDRPTHRGAQPGAHRRGGPTLHPGGTPARVTQGNGKAESFQRRHRTERPWSGMSPQNLRTDTKNTAIKEIHKSDLIRIKTFAAWITQNVLIDCHAECLPYCSLFSLLESTPLCWRTKYSIGPTLTDRWVVRIWVVAATTAFVHNKARRAHPRLRVAGHFSARTCQTGHANSVPGGLFLHSHLHAVPIVGLLNFCRANRRAVVLTVSICTSLMIWEYSHVMISCLYILSHAGFTQIFCSMFVLVCLFFLLSFEISLYIIDPGPLWNLRLANISSHTLASFSCFLTVIFHLRAGFLYGWSPQIIFLNFFYMDCGLAFVSEKCLHH